MATLIYDIDDLQAIQNDLTADYELANDIDASVTKTWNWNAGRGIYEGFARIGGNFIGSFDGKGYTIFKLYMNYDDYAIAMFYSINGAIVTNFRLENCEILAKHTFAILACYIENGATVSDIYVNGTLVGSAIDNNAGGLAAWLEAATIEDCHAVVHIDWEDGSDFACLVGNAFADGGHVYITRCSGRGSLNGDWGLGALVGWATANQYNTYHVYIDECFGNVTITGNEQIGALVGRVQYKNVHIKESYGRGILNGKGSGDKIGGLVGYYKDSDIEDSFAAAQIIGATNLGGLIGQSAGTVTVTTSYWDIEVSGQIISSGGGTGKITSEMRMLATYSDWDIEEASPDPNSGYPYLHWEIGQSPTSWYFPKQSPRQTIAVEDKITLETIRNIEMAARGRFYIDEEGNAVYDSRFVRMQ